MRWRPLAWFLLSLLCFGGALYFWRLGDRWAAKPANPPAQSPGSPVHGPVHAARSPQHASGAPIRLLTQPGNLNSPAALPSPTDHKAPATTRFAYRLSNTTKTVGQLVHNDKAILLENALLETGKPLALSIPESLRSEGDPGTYIVQSRTALDGAFRALLQQAGASIVSYIPNNAYLVRASATAAEQLKANPQTQEVLPYEPYYKLKPALLELAVNQEPLPADSSLNVLIFADARPATEAALQQLGAEIVGEDRSPFGPVLKVQAPANSLAALARLPGVQEVELAHARVMANDLSRAAIGVAVNSVVQTNYLNLTGTNVIVNINDTGVDTNHPDLQGRVLLDAFADTNLQSAGIDVNGHGTHVAGIIAGSGLMSTTVTNASGSSNPGTNFQYRGKAPGALLFSMLADQSDYYLQETAARTNAVISNNSWNYGVNSYDLAAASYDAAVRDALPEVSGSQPIIYVFDAGNSGGGDDTGLSGNSETILSPGTAKNVITVGAIEQFRSITNQTVMNCQPVNTGTNTITVCQTNTPWLGMTDSGNEVAWFSSRGNVGVGIEGDYGRFKPDVVAPGTFVISTRSGQWDEAAYYNPTNYHYDYFTDSVDTNSLENYSIFVPANAVQMIINVYGPVDMPIFLKNSDNPTATTYDLLKTNQVSMPPDLALNAPTIWFYSVGNPTNRPVKFAVSTEIITTNDYGNEFEVLSNMNDSLGSGPPYYYRYESGTSMAAGDVSGTLALMQEFFQQRLGRTNSPALMKALLINGARSVNTIYDLEVTNSINYQGWGLVNLTNSVPTALTNLNTPSALSMQIFDQNATNALSTGQRHTWTVTFPPPQDAVAYTLRTTLVWTDPPGNPVASLKLVNDLDLVVTNLDTGDVYFGNDITTGNNFNTPWDTNAVPNIDSVNNVENVYLVPPLATNGYTVTVIGRHVNVNAVTANPNDVVQDYALVISSGNGQVPNALTVTDTPTVATLSPNVTVVTNQFASLPDTSGGILFNQLVGANTPLLGTNDIPMQGANPDPWSGGANGVITFGMTNQWHFYILSNQFNFQYAAFVVMQAETLSMPRMGLTNTANPANATRAEADIDLYVSTDSTLTNLGANAITLSDKSLDRGGTEFVILSNVAPGAVYYVGVKSEDQQAAEYTFFGVFSQNPFAGTDNMGNPILRGIPVPQTIPDGSPARPGAALVFAFGIDPYPIREVIVTNTLTHENFGDLIGNLTHDKVVAVLNNHTFPPVNPPPITYQYVWEDNGEIPGVPHTDGPGSLTLFNGDKGAGLWLLTMVDDALTQTGRVENLWIKIEKEVPNGVLTPETVQPFSWKRHTIDVPPGATALTICVLSNALPLDLYIQLGSDPTQSSFDYHFTVTAPAGGCFTITPFDSPPLASGRYHIGIYNPNSTAVDYLYSQDYTIAPVSVSSTLATSGSSVTIQDDAVTYAYLTNNSHMLISSMDVGLLIQDLRISDLALTLISPNGTRVLLFQDRGGTSTNGMGTFSLDANGLPVTSIGTTNMTPFYTNDFETAPVGLYAPGSIFEGWTVLTNFVTVFNELPAPWLSNNVLVLGEGAVSNALPTTNSTSYHLTFDVTHAPYLAGMIGWWPLDQDASDIFGGHDGLLCGDVTFVSTGMVSQAFYGDGVSCTIMVPSCPALDVGHIGYTNADVQRSFTFEGWINPFNVTNPAPLVEWNDPTNRFPLGVQFWLAQRADPTNGPGSLTAVLWDTNLQPHVISTPDMVVTNRGWQHVALTYDSAALVARIYTNGQLAALPLVVSATNFVPRTSANLYFGYHPAGPLAGASFQGGLDELSLFDRALTDCEIAAIFNAGSAGKYGTNVLSCPLTNTPSGASLTVQLTTATGASTTLLSTFTFTNGLTWTNGPQWETDSIDFTNLLLYAGTNGPATNFTSIIFTNGDPNIAVDNFVLSALLTNYVSTLLHFTEDTNLALIPIKFAPAPYVMSNFPPTLIFSNDFEIATQGVFQAGDVLRGSTSNPAFGPRDWTVTAGPITVVSNSFLADSGTNWIALARGAIQSTLPTVPGHKYQLSYSVHGPCAVGWWNGAIEPYSRRTWDLIGGNNGAMIDGATNTTTAPNPYQAVDDTEPAVVGDHGLYFNGLTAIGTSSNATLASKIELGDPANLKFTNSFTIEGWIKPATQTNIFYNGLDPEDDRAIEQILFRGDERDCRDPYWLGFEYDPAGALEILFHVEGPNSPTCGYTMETPNAVPFDQWTHVAAVFEYNYQWTNNPPWPTNRLRIYLDGQVAPFFTSATQPEPVVDGLTGEAPFADLDPAYNPGVTIGARSRYDFSQSYRGWIDELSVYGRALTDAEIKAIHDAGANGKADLTVPPAQALAKLNVLLDGVLMDTGYGDNSQWTTRNVVFTATQTNTVLDLKSLLPGTFVDGITLTELPAPLDYLPEDPLSALNGEDAFGVWTLEIWDTRAGGNTTNDPAQLLDWQLNFALVPSNPPPIITLTHGISYSNSLPAFGIQNFIVPMPQWATNATNVLEFANQFRTTNPLPVTVLFDTNQFPCLITNAIPLFTPPGSFGTTNLSTNTLTAPWIVSARNYFLTVTNPNPVGVSFGLGVWFNINSLTNCQLWTNFWVGPAGVPSYFQFDVPTNDIPGFPPQSATFWVSGAQSNLTVVLSQHLPLPDLGHYDYISQQPCTNDEIVMVVTNTTPFPLLTNRWYAAVFNSAATNVPFTVQVCYATNYPVIIPLTNAVPYFGDFILNTNFLAPPGPPQKFFFQFQITNWTDAVLFEMYGLSGDADLVLERDVPPAMSPYWAGSFRTGLTPEQIVLRTSTDLADLRGNWYLGVYNNDLTNVAYTLQAAVQTGGLLLSAQPLVMTASIKPASPHNILLQWNAVEGEKYVVYYATNLVSPIFWTPWAGLIATTPCPSISVPILPNGNRFYRLGQVISFPIFSPPLFIQLWPVNEVRISWPTSYPGFSLQYLHQPPCRVG